MKQVFSVMSEINHWIRNTINDPKTRLYSSTSLVAMGILACNQMGVPATLSSLQRITEFSSMQIYRGTNTLTKHGFLSRDDDGVWMWAVNVPNDIKELHPSLSNNTGVEELKAFITEAFSNIQLDTPNGQAKIKQVVETVQHFDPKKKRQPLAETGPKALFGDAVLDIDND